jgi:hypothetical protein
MKNHFLFYFCLGGGPGLGKEFLPSPEKNLSLCEKHKKTFKDIYEDILLFFNLI